MSKFPIIALAQVGSQIFHCHALHQKPPQAVTQQSVADAAGVHYSTVSLSLRNSPEIPEATRARIRSIARKLGYVPNPLVSTLLSRIRQGQIGYRGTLAYLHPLPPGHPDLKIHFLRMYLEGARDRAASFGFELEEYHLGATGISARRLIEIWRARGIVGVVIVHLPGSPFIPHRRLPIDVKGFAAASLCAPLESPRVNFAANDQYLRPLIAARRLAQLGYRRFGLLLGRRFDAIVSHRCSAGYWALQEFNPQLPRLAPLFLRTDDDGRKIRRWLSRERPEVILTDQETLVPYLANLGRRVPEDLGVVHLDWAPRMKQLAGVHPNFRMSGAACVELIVSQLARNEFGEVNVRYNLLVEGSWISGPSVRRIGRASEIESQWDRFDEIDAYSGGFDLLGEKSRFGPRA